MSGDRNTTGSNGGSEGNRYGAVPPVYEEDEGTGSKLHPRRFLGLAITHKWLIIGITCVVTLAGFLHSSFQTPLYMANATVLVERGSAPVRELPNPGQDWTQDQIFFTSQLGVMKSHDVAKAALSELPPALAAQFQGLPDPAAALSSLVSVSRERDSALFEFSAVSPSPRAAAELANAFAKAYREEAVRQNIDFISETNKLLMEQAKKLQLEYAATQKQYGNYLSKTGNYYPKNQQSIVDARIQSLELRKSQILIDKQTLDARMIPLFQVQKGTLDPLAVSTVRDDAIVKGLVDQYEAGQKELAKMAAQFTAEYPPYKKKAAELESIRTRIRAQALTLLNAEESRRNSLASELASLDKELLNLKNQSINLAEGSSEAVAMGSGVEALQKYMTLLTDKIREMDVAGKVLTSRVTIVNQARVPGYPFQPKRAKTTLLALLLGLMLSASVVGGIELLDTRIKDPENIERRLGVPVVGLIPLYVQEDHWLVEEAYQTLRTSLYYVSDHMKKNVLMVASPSSGEGKSSVSTNLGIIMSTAGERVLLIDCDVRKSSLHRFLKMDGKKGITDFLGSADPSPEGFIKPTSHENLSLLAAGPSPLNPPALFSMSKFRDLVKWAREKYDWVILDTPPFVAVTDGMLIADSADLILFVAAMKSTHEPLLKKALEQAYRLDKDLAGIVLNRFDWRLPDYYHYYYGRYYNKHYHYYGGKNGDSAHSDKDVSMAGRIKRLAMGGKRKHSKRPHA